MTTDSDRHEIHATADPDSLVEADPSLTDGERPADDELSDGDERLGTEDGLSGSAEDQDADTEDQDDDQIIIERSDVVSPIAPPGEASDAYDRDGTGDEDDLDDEDDEDDDEDEDGEVASAVVVTEVVSDPYGQEAADENELNDEDIAGAASMDGVPAVPAPAHERAPADTSLGGGTGLAGDGEEIHQRWAAIQSGFVDDPHQSVADAAAFLEETTAALVASISELRGEWDNQSLDTEGLRTMLRRYRAVLDRISAF